MSTSAASPGFMCKLKDRQEVAEGTMAFWFEKPSGWTFKPGQFLDITLLDPSATDSEKFDGTSATISNREHDLNDRDRR